MVVPDSPVPVVAVAVGVIMAEVAEAEEQAVVEVHGVAVEAEVALPILAE